MSRYFSVFVGHLNPDTRKCEVRDLFKQCGTVADIFICANDRPGGYSYGFVRFLELADAERAIRELHRWELGGTSIIVQMARDTLEKLRREKALEEANVVTRPRPRSTVSSSSNIIEDTMYLARVKENCTTLGIQQIDAGKNISFLMDDIQKVNTKRSSSHWGPLTDAVMSFDHVTKKLVSRSQETGEKGRLLGAQKSHEFITSLKTIMQEIEDFLSQTARNASNIATELCGTNAAETGKDMLSKLSSEEKCHLDGIKAKLVAQYLDETVVMESSCNDVGHEVGETHSAELELDDMIMRDKREKIKDIKDMQIENESFVSSENIRQEKTNISNYHEHIIDQNYTDSDNAISDTESITATLQLARSEMNQENTRKLERSYVSDTCLGDEINDKASSSRRISSLGSGLSSLTLKRSPIVCVDTEESIKEVTKETPRLVKDKYPQVATFYLTETPKVELNETRINLDSLKDRKEGDGCGMSEAASIDYKNTVLRRYNENDNSIKRQAISVDSDFSERDPASNSVMCSCERNDFYFEETCSQQFRSAVKPKEAKHDSHTEVSQNEVIDQKGADSLALQALFAKLPPVGSLERSNSQDSSLSEDSFEGIDDSGVESDFRPNFKPGQRLQEHSEHLKSMLGIKPSINGVNVSSGAYAVGVNRASSVPDQRLKNFKKQLNASMLNHDDNRRVVGRGVLSHRTMASYGRGRMFDS